MTTTRTSPASPNTTANSAGGHADSAPGSLTEWVRQALAARGEQGLPDRVEDATVLGTVAHLLLEPTRK